MKTLSLLQPWATLVVIGAKKFETRSWATPYRGPLLIHASKRFTRNERQYTVLPVFYNAVRYSKHRCYDTGSILGRVEIVDCLSTIDALAQGMIDDREYEFGNYQHGRFAWRLANPIEFDDPIPARGSLGLWEFPESKIKEVPCAGKY